MSTTQEVEYPDYVLGCLVGIAAAFALMPVRMLIVQSTYYVSHFSDPFVLALMTPALVGLAVRLGAKRSGDVPLAIIGLFLTLIHIVGAHYWVANTLVNLLMGEMRWGSVEFILPVTNMLGLILAYFRDAPYLIGAYIVGALASVLFTLVRDRRAAPARHPLEPEPSPAPAPAVSSLRLRAGLDPAPSTKASEPEGELNSQQ